MEEKEKSTLKVKATIDYTKKTFYKKIYDCFLSFLLLFGFILSLSGSTAVSIDYITLFLISIFICIVMTFSYKKSKKMKITYYAFPIIAIIILLLLFLENIINGFLLFYNSVLNNIGELTGNIMPLLSVYENNANFDLLLWFVFLTLILIIPISMSVNSNSIMVPVFLILFSFALSCICGEFSVIGTIMIMNFFISFFINYVSQKKINGASSYNYLNLIISFLLIAVTSISAIIIGNSISSDYISWSNTKRNINSIINKIQYGNDYIMPDGDFAKLKDYAPGEKDVLEIVMSKPESYYLRGFVGSKYNGNGWDSTDNKTLYSNKNLFYHLHQNSFYGQTQLGDLSNLINLSNEKNKVTVKNIAASTKYMYTPYEMLSLDKNILNESLIGDETLYSSGLFGEKTYSFTAADNQIKKYTSIAYELYKKQNTNDASVDFYLNNESHYNEYVYSNYLKMPDDIKNMICNLLGGYNINYGNHLDYKSAKQNILYYLTSNINYETEVDIVLENKDFVSAFLQETQSGYSVHFATAATLMFRYYGIPARYVEGYLVTPKDIEGVLSNSLVVIDETHAHAWTEFYQDGVGWIPFEVTPPYLNIMEKADELNVIDRIKENNKSKDDDSATSPNQSQNQEFNNHITEMVNYPFIQIIFNILASFFAASILIFIVFVLNRKNKFKKLIISFENKDNSFAVISLFVYCIQLLKLIKIFDSANSVYCCYKKLQDSFDSDYVNLYFDAFSIYQEAKFSNHNISKKQKDILFKFKSETVLSLKSKRKTISKFIDKYVLYIY